MYRTDEIAIILFIPAMICKIGNKIGRKEGLFCILGLGAIGAAGVLFLTDNLSTAIIVMGMSCIMFLLHIERLLRLLQLEQR